MHGPDNMKFKNIIYSTRCKLKPHNDARNWNIDRQKPPITYIAFALVIVILLHEMKGL
jgi:hypothetical protein